MTNALQLMHENGYVIGGRRGAFGLRKARWMLRHHREVGIVDPSHGIQIELHSRLLGYPPEGWRDPPVGAGALDLSDPDFVLYLIVHGALTGWKRLKWLCDLVMLVDRVPVETRWLVLSRARAVGCEAALVASLLTLADLWGDDVVADWLAETQTAPDTALVQSHLKAVSRRLGLESQPPFPERALRHAGIINDAAVFGRHPAPFRGFGDRAALWFLAKL